MRFCGLNSASLPSQFDCFEVTCFNVLNTARGTTASGLIVGSRSATSTCRTSAITYRVGKLTGCLPDSTFVTEVRDNPTALPKSFWDNFNSIRLCFSSFPKPRQTSLRLIIAGSRRAILQLGVLNVNQADTAPYLDTALMPGTRNTLPNPAPK